ncbi:coiled-coil domain-containing protein 121 isoform X1 [Bubalus kerabau]|uniref:coiled-coil domain-containing protein 121 isoform X1 n=2 Tax=Bubalus carabanensis TaxID=3119969 RepID=UPI00244E7402|nr:coiled-coil domain-containing protein 121 isoform X1 [Bubalus carabanensis]
MGAQLGTPSGKWRHWEDGWKRPTKELFTVVGQGLGRSKLWTPGGQDNQGPQGPPGTPGTPGTPGKTRDSRATLVKRVRSPVSPRGAGNRASGEAAVRALPSVEEVRRLRTARQGTLTGCEPQSCWATPRSAEPSSEKLGITPVMTRYFRVLPAPKSSSRSLVVSRKGQNRDTGEKQAANKFVKLAEDTSNSLQPDVNFIHTFLKPEKLTRVEKRFKGRAVMEMMKLDKEIKETQTRLEPLVVETRQLLEEKDHIQKENQFFQEYLTKQTEESRQRTEKLWNYYLQQSMKIEQRKQELTSKYANKNSALKRELLEKENTLSNLNKQLEAMRDISVIKEKQDREIEKLQQEIKKTHVETAAKKQAMLVQFFQDKALLEAQLSELEARQSGKKLTKELKSKNQALEKAAKQHVSEFHSNINRQHQQLQKELPELVQKCHQLEDTHSQLKKKKQLLQQEHWYVECLRRGRQQLQERRNRCPNGQGSPKTTRNPALGTKSKVHPKKFLK